MSSSDDDSLGDISDTQDSDGNQSFGGDEDSNQSSSDDEMKLLSKLAVTMMVLKSWKPLKKLSQ